MTDDPTAYFWDLADSFLARDGFDEGRVLSFPCLRYRGEFVAMCEHRTGDLVAKLPATRVDELVAAGVGQPFGPGDRVFREWVRVPERDERRWTDLVEEAVRFAGERT